MFLLNTQQQILALVFFVASMLSIGMQTDGPGLRELLASPGLLLRALLANFVFVPAVGIALAHWLPLEPPVKGALLLLACAPGGLSAIQFTTKAKGGATLAGALVFLLSVLSVLLSPALLACVLPQDVALVVPYGRALVYVAVCLLLPLLIGMLVLRGLPNAAPKLSKLLALVALIAFVWFMLVTSGFRKAAIVEIGWPAIGALLLFLLASMVIGWLLGGPARSTRQLVATATGMRNALLCIAIVRASAPDNAVMTPLIAFSMLMVPPNMLLTVYSLIQDKRAAKKAAAAGAR